MIRRNISLRLNISILFTILMVVTVVSVSAIVFRSWFSSIHENIKQMEIKVSSDIYQEIDALVNIPISINKGNSYILQNGIVDIKNKPEREAFFAGVVKSSGKEIYSVSYGTEAGEYYGARRNKENQIEIYRSDSSTDGHSFYYSVNEELVENEFVQDFGKFDPRTRDWYLAAKESKGPVFSKLYKHFVKNDLALSAAYPLYDETGNLQGVLGTHITLTRLNNYLVKSVQDNHAMALIIENGTGLLVGNSMKLQNFKENEAANQYERVSITEINAPVVREAYQQYRANLTNQFTIHSNHDKYYINFAHYNKAGLDWLILTAIPERAFTSQLNQTIWVLIALILFAIILSVVIYIKSTKFILKPVNELVRTVKRFSSGDLSSRATVYRQHEVGELAETFNSMADQINGLIHNLEDKVRERTAELESANLAKSQFVANMSHEIRTPMNGIVGFVRLLEETKISEEQQEYLDAINNSINSLLSVINHILDFSKIESGKVELESIPFNIRLLMEDVAVSYIVKAEEKGLDLNLLVEPDVPDFLIGDPTRLTQILNNLLSNAMKFTDCGEIYFGVRLKKQKGNKVHLQITVKDTGIGITEQERGKLFQPFAQADSSSTRKYGGTGLGLVITCNLVDLMGGTIDLISEKGKGSEFKIELELEKETPETGTYSKETDLKPSILQGKRILYITGNQVSWEATASYLKTCGTIVEQAWSLETLGSSWYEEFDLVIVDYQIYQQNKDRIGSLVRMAKTNDLPLVLIVPYTMNSSSKKRLRNDFDTCIPNPLKKNSLIRCIADTLQSNKTETERTCHEEKGNDFHFDTSISCKVLLVDDNEINRKIMIKFLDKFGLSCDVAETGAEAVRACEARFYDLIFMDCQMPVLDGYEATRRIRSLQGERDHSMIIAMTAFSMREDEEKCLKAGMDDYISKPIDLSQLMVKLKQYCSNTAKWHSALLDSESRRELDVKNALDSLMYDSGFDWDTCVELLHDFCEHTETLIKKINSSMEHHQLEEIGVSLHQIKGSAGNIRAKEIARLAQASEEALKDGKKKELNSYLDELNKAFHLFRDQLERGDFFG